MDRRLQRGTSLLEVSISTALLSFLVFAAASASRIAITTADDVTVRDATTGGARRNAARFEGQLISVSLSSLQGIPANQGVAVEPMLENVDYQELQFRRVTGFEQGAIVYEPALGTAAARLYRAVDPKTGIGTLALENRGLTSTLLEGVRSVNFRRVDSTLTITVTTGRGNEVPTTRTTNLVLRVP
jgi:hypothetical protein